MDKSAVQIYLHPNREIRSFLTAQDIFAPRVAHFQNPLDKASEDTLNPLSMREAQVVREIMAVPGVEEVYVKPNEVRMKKKLSSSWEDIEHRVVEILKRALRKKEIKLVKP